MSSRRRLLGLFVLPVALLADCVLPFALATSATTPVVAVTATAAPSTSAPAATLKPTATASPTTSAPATPSTTLTTSAPTSATPTITGSVDLSRLTIKGRAPRTGYDRALFGQRWADVDRNGCDTRNDILRRDLVEVTIKPGTNGCKVTAGTLHDPYSGRMITKDHVQVDHVVALFDAWQKGAQAWTPEQRLAFANDPANLQATVGSVNQAKGASDAASWLPPNKAYRCEYVKRQVEVKVSYELWVTQAEHDAFARVLASCAGRIASSSTTSSSTTSSSTTTSATPAPTKPVAALAQGGQCDPAYPSECIPPVEVAGDLDCPDITARRFAVLSPDPHNFDGNHDGVGCEG